MLDRNFLIIEDNKNKKNILINDINRIYNYPNIRTVDNLQDAINIMRCNGEMIDLVVLDWNFPQYKGRNPQIGIGREFLEYMKQSKMNNNVIICASCDIDDLTGTYPNVLGHVFFNVCNAGIEIDYFLNQYWKNVSNNYQQIAKSKKLTFSSHK